MYIVDRNEVDRPMPYYMPIKTHHYLVRVGLRPIGWSILVGGVLPDLHEGFRLGNG